MTDYWFGVTVGAGSAFIGTCIGSYIRGYREGMREAKAARSVGCTKSERLAP